MAKVMTAEQAAALIKDGATVSIVGSGGGVMDPERVFQAVEKRFLETGHPAELTLMHASGIGDKKEKGINRFAHEGMVRRVIGGHWGWSPTMQQMALEGKIEAYNFPQGIIVIEFSGDCGSQTGADYQGRYGYFCRPPAWRRYLK